MGFSTSARRLRTASVTAFLLGTTALASGLPGAAASGVTAATSAEIGAALAAPTAPGGFVATAPTVVLDTAAGIGSPKALIAAGASITVPVAGVGAIPASGVGAVALDVVVPSQAGGMGSFVVSAGPAAADASPTIYFGGDTRVSTSLVLALAADGSLTATNRSTAAPADGAANLQMQVTGYYLAGTSTATGAFVPLAPTTIVDTRTGLGRPTGAGALASKQLIAIDVTGAGGLPATTPDTVLLRVTADPTSKGVGWLRLYSDLATDPGTSQVRYGVQAPLATTAMVPVKLSAGARRIRLVNASAIPAHVRIDVLGYSVLGDAVAPGSLVSMPRTRVMDTTSGLGTAASPIAGGETRTVSVRPVVPSSNVAAVVLHAVVPAAPRRGSAVIHEGGTSPLGIGQLHWGGGGALPHALVTLPVAPDGTVSVSVLGASTRRMDVILDVVGFVLAPVQHDAIAVDGACALTVDGGLRCWGGSAAAPVGDGSELTRVVPVDIVGMSQNVAQVASDIHTCAISTTGALTCWGYNNFGQTGDGSMTTHLVPQPVTGMSSGVVKVAVGNQTTCAIKNDGSLWCWGYNYEGQIGDGTRVNQSTPKRVIASGVTDVSVGQSHTCAVVAGAAKCWGKNLFGRVGDGTITRRLVPTPVVGLGHGVSAVSAGWGHSCAVTSVGAVWCWGYNQSAQLGDGTTDNRYVPTPVNGLQSGIATVVSHTTHSCALSTSGVVLCWGPAGDTGISTFTSTPTTVPGIGPGAVAISGSCAVTAAKAVLCWGANTTGQVGDGTTTRRITPTPVVGF